MIGHLIRKRPSPFLYPGAEIAADTSRAGCGDRAAGPVSMEGQMKAAIEVGRGRLAITAGVFLLAFCVIGLRLVDLMALEGGEAMRRAEAAASGGGTVEAVVHRADIVDRNGVLLATNLPTVNLYADARKVLDPAETARAWSRCCRIWRSSLCAASWPRVVRSCTCAAI